MEEPSLASIAAMTARDVFRAHPGLGAAGAAPAALLPKAVSAAGVGASLLCSVEPLGDAAVVRARARVVLRVAE